jgi:hypothetical protein
LGKIVNVDTNEVIYDGSEETPIERCKGESFDTVLVDEILRLERRKEVVAALCNSGAPNKRLAEVTIPWILERLR